MIIVNTKTEIYFAPDVLPEDKILRSTTPNRLEELHFDLQ